MAVLRESMKMEIFGLRNTHHLIPHSFLNGFIYSIYGLIDFYRITHDKKIEKIIDSCFETIKNNIHKYDSGYWSYYDQLKKNLLRYYYQKNVHFPQLKTFYILTNDEIFNKYAVKWEKNVNPFDYIFVKLSCTASNRE